LRVASGDSPRRGGDEGEGDACGFTNDRVSNKEADMLKNPCKYKLMEEVIRRSQI